MSWIGTIGNKFGVKVTFVKNNGTSTTKSSRTYNGINIGSEGAVANPTMMDVLDGFDLLFASSIMNNAVATQADLITTKTYIPEE